MNLSHKLFTRNVPEDLGCIDAFYKVTVSQLCTDARKQYCVNLIGRLREDLRGCGCREEMKQIKRHMQAARAELNLLSGSASG